jgi:hypothetical protein
MAALKLVVNDKAAAAKLTDAYFKGTFQGQVQANGDQVRFIILSRFILS